MITQTRKEIYTSDDGDESNEENFKEFLDSETF